jgi:hypothetical protein
MQKLPILSNLSFNTGDFLPHFEVATLTFRIVDMHDAT